MTKYRRLLKTKGSMLLSGALKSAPVFDLVSITACHSLSATPTEGGKHEACKRDV